MKTTVNSKAETTIPEKIAAISTEADLLSLEEFNREHGAEIRRIADATKRYQKAQRVNRMFEVGMVLLLLSTAGASAIGLLTMIAR